MKILQVIRSMNPEGGGTSEGVARLTFHLEESSIQSCILTLDSPDEPWIASCPHPVKALGPVLGNYGFRSDLASQIQALSLETDAVLVHGLWQYHALATWQALRGSRVPYFVYPHGMLDPWFRRTYPLKHLKKWAYWPWADYRVLRDAQAVLFTTDQERLLARESFWLYQARERVVGFGTSTPPRDAEQQREAFFQHFPELRGQRILLFLSRIHPKKGVDMLLESFADVAASDPRLHLVIAGPDQTGMQAALKQQAISLGISTRLTWTGMLTGDLKWGAFRAAELFCLPSHQENFGIVVAEALACGLPVAIAKPVNISSEVAAAAAGIVHADTVAGTTEALRQWLATSPSEQAQMGQRGLQLFQERFDFASVARNLLPVLEAALPSQRMPAVR